MSNYWPQYGIFRVLHGLFGLEQRILRVSTLRRSGRLPLTILGIYSQRWGVPRLLLSTYLQFCSALSFVVTVWLLFVTEVSESTRSMSGTLHNMLFQQDKEVDDEDLNIKSVYKTMWSICKLKRTCHALCK